MKTNDRNNHTESFDPEDLVRGLHYSADDFSVTLSTSEVGVIWGDALFFRMKANPAAGQTATAEVSIQGVKRTITVKS